ncbi:hypothetical protein [Bacillus sp. UNC41MFS5]|uniref:hypothetical protein n=1 Tax=Bacillus sp. UNC41MFS5 TaxID=1449046 RepID=UPI00047B80EE|nr:hypothetical protein [Bacillus sp. UNC41MFS5]
MTQTIESGYDNIRFGAYETNTEFFKVSVKDLMVIDVTTNVSFNPDAYGDGWWISNPPPVGFGSSSKFKGKAGLAIGDSLTSVLKWQETVKTTHQFTIDTHALNGVGFISMVDGGTTSVGTIAALTVAQVTSKDFIVIYGGMNERNSAYGVKGDLYPAQTTIWGRFSMWLTNCMIC